MGHQESIPDSSVRSSAGWRVAIAILLIVIGVGLRIRLFTYDQSFWWDEASIADNMATHSYGQLLQPLDHQQAAPVGWLMLVKTSTVLFGPGEMALRTVPFLAALAAIPVFLLLARRLLPPHAALLALGLFVICPPAIGYGGEAKQYSTDALAALLATLATVAAIQSGLARRQLMVLAITGAVLIWFSHPVVFVMATAGGVLAAYWHGHRSRSTLWSLAAVAGVWTVSFALDWALFLHHTAHSDYMQRYWSFAFAPWPTHPAVLAWYQEFIPGLFSHAGGLKFPVLPMALWVLGVLAIGKRTPLAAALLAGPALVVLVASSFGKYPFFGRMLVFLMPGVVLAVAAGIWWLRQKAGRWPGVAVAGLALALVAWHPLKEAGQTIVRPDTKTNADISPVMRHIQANWREGDVIYAHWGLAFSVKYYQSRTTRLPQGPLILAPRMEKQGDCLEHLRTHRGLRRVWVVFGSLCDSESWDCMLAPAALDCYRAPSGARAVLCDLSRLLEQP